VDLILKDSFFHKPDIINNVRIDRISLIAAASFVISSCAVILLLFSPEGKQRVKGIAAYLLPFHFILE